MTKKKQSSEQDFLAGYIPAIPAEAIQTEFFDSTKNEFKPPINYPVRKYVARQNSTSGSFATIYTVPTDSNFMLLSCYIGYTADNSSGSGQYDLTTNIPSCNTLLELFSRSPAIGSVVIDHAELEFGEGMLFPSGTVFQIGNSGDFVTGGVAGYEIQAKSITPTYN